MHIRHGAALHSTCTRIFNGNETIKIAQIRVHNTYQPDTNPNPNPNLNLSTKEHSKVNI